jgi:hypothetical protein
MECEPSFSGKCHSQTLTIIFFLWALTSHPDLLMVALIMETFIAAKVEIPSLLISNE